MLIAFSGLDGAGKSTQIQLLQTFLQDTGQSTITIWARGGYTSGINKLKNLVRKFNSAKIPSSGKSEERDNAFKNHRVRKLWLAVAILDLLFLYAIRVRWLKFRGIHVIFDRFLEDTLLDFQLNFPQERIENWWLWKLSKTVIPYPKKHFILLIPVQESQRRSILKNEPFPDSKMILEKRLIYYQQLTQSTNRYVYLDGTNSIDSIFHDIKSHIIN